VSWTDPAHTGPITPDLEGLRRLERRIKRSLSIKAAWRRVWESLPAILQVTVAAVASYLIAHYWLGHPLPIVAVTVTITSLGFNRDARPVRVLRSILAILLGVVLATGILVVAGTGIWQLIVVLLVVLITARLLTRDLVFPVAAATPAALTVLLGDLYGDPYLRVFDACVAAVIALLVTALIPRAPGRDAAREGRAATSAITEAVRALADAFTEGSTAAAELANARLAKLPPLVDAWRNALETARSVSRISPFLRNRLPELDRAMRLQRGIGAAGRHLALIARRARSMVREGGRQVALAGLIEEVGRGLALLIEEQRDLELTGAARSVLTGVASRLRPEHAVPGASIAATAVVLQLRPLVVDLLVTTGLPLEEAQARLVEL